MSTMIWRRLKNNKCPVCNQILVEKKGKRVFCSKKHFSIPYGEFEEVINHLYRKKGFPVEWKKFCGDEIIINKT